MKTLERSILRELIMALVLGLFAFNFVLVTEKLLKLTKLLAAVGASVFDVAMLVVYLQPTLTILTTPIAMLLSILVTYGRLNSDNELIVMRTGGMSFRHISRPVFLLGTGCFLAGAFVSFFLAPLSSRNLRESVANVIERRAPYAIEEGIFATTFGDTVVYVKEKPEESTLRSIFIYDTRQPDRPVAMYAREGRLSSRGGGEVSLDLSDGHMYLLRGTRMLDLSFARYRLHLPLAARSSSQELDELTPPGLYREVQRSEGRHRVELLLELQRRLSMPALCLVLMLAGPPLALMAGKTGRLGGLSLGLLVFGVYYGLLMYAENLAVSGAIPPVVGAWGPMVLLGAFSLWLFRREEMR
jgi:lipopolysaccharide export system permease protein